jgi:hypothetical protein
MPSSPEHHIVLTEPRRLGDWGFWKGGMELWTLVTSGMWSPSKIQLWQELLRNAVGWLAFAELSPLLWLNPWYPCLKWVECTRLLPISCMGRQLSGCQSISWFRHQNWLLVPKLSAVLHSSVQSRKLVLPCWGVCWVLGYFPFLSSGFL